MKLHKLAALITAASLLQGCVAAAVVGVVGGATVAADNRSVGAQIDDQNIELQGYAKLAEHKGISDNTNLQITSMNGSVLVVGQAPNTYLRDEALKILKSVTGVVQIHNQIRLGNTVSVATKSNDIWLTSKVKTALFKSDKVDANNIKVVTENAEVFLMGLVSRGEADQAVNIARNIGGVNRVVKAFEYQ
ncbi:division/outer membrane stress-associated lipid-binding lipoprotein [Thalassotalea euphylliae]|uniref:Osmotically-inducible protein OsmY n=1 Tax=Thalassotalea euphylliae TaxID=1655234 RepID=A0A3E0UEW9_9GAMM|nr:division/outer membrane stress-associated lipid-binding lipoprotein [Thalassotalea euphylliae]REL34362.1 osmotically-inducible protein OsmY [Thalassotalea euphylliae]